MAARLGENDMIQEKIVNKEIAKMIAPTNLTTNDSCGILIDGFQLPFLI
ncbi:MAG: hypothetical protein FWF70_03410 [Bacteroidetes bacterium]|nr:hypothetical protein [Bacteroidota bacterium]